MSKGATHLSKLERPSMNILPCPASTVRSVQERISNQATSISPPTGIQVCTTTWKGEWSLNLHLPVQALERASFQFIKIQLPNRVYSAILLELIASSLTFRLFVISKPQRTRCCFLLTLFKTIHDDLVQFLNLHRLPYR
jgi:hypothetical protein